MTWAKVRDFFQQELPRWMREELVDFVRSHECYRSAYVRPQNLVIREAIMLDGGGAPHSSGDGLGKILLRSMIRRSIVTIMRRHLLLSMPWLMHPNRRFILWAVIRGWGTSLA
jgi:hypothetical protein